ncbi:UNVERIFIED_CONTAM: flagellin [Comamonas sp. A-3]|nr:flagellin [Comamonas thiooxydans]
MAATINTNIQSLNAQRNLSASQNQLATSMQRLSSGLRINSAKDDAAGLAISERMSTQVRGLTVAARNANDGISLAQTAEGALSSIGNNLQRIRELAVQSRNATNSAEDRQALNAEVQQLKSEVTRIAQQTSFNGTKLLDGNFTNMAFQVGANQSETINISQITNANINELGNWSSAVTNASVEAANKPTAAPAGGTKTSLLAFVSSASSSAAGEAFSVKVNGVSVFAQTSTAAGQNVTAGDIDAELSSGSVQANLAAKGITATKGANAGEWTFSSSTGGEIKIEQVNQFGGTSAAGGFNGLATDGTLDIAATGKFAEIKSGEFTIQGTKADGSPSQTVNIKVGEASSAEERSTALMNAINAQTGETGVTAFVVNGKLTLESKNGDFTLGGAAPGVGITGTGLLAGSSASLAGATKFAKGETKTGFADLDVSSTAGADNAILAMDAALMAVNGARATLGAVQSRFETTVENLSVTTENLSASRGRIMDADFAVETANLSRTQILQQAGTAMVAQANQLPQSVLKLLQG